MLVIFSVLPLFTAAARLCAEDISKEEPTLVWRQSSWGYALSFALSPDGEVVALPERSNLLIRLVRLRDGQVIAKFQCASGIKSLAFSPDGKFLAVGAESGGLYVWRVADGALVVQKAWEPRAAVSTLAFSENGQYLAAAVDTGSEKFIRIWRVADWQVVSTIRPPYKQIESLAFSPDGKLLAAGGWLADPRETVIRLWRPQDGKLTGLIPYDAPGSPRSLAFSPDGTWLAAAFSEAVKIWSVADGSLVKEIPEGVDILAFSKNGRYLLSANTFFDILDMDMCDFEKRRLKPAIRLWKVGQWESLAELPAGNGVPRVHDVAVAWEKGVLVCLEGDAVSAWCICEEGFYLLQRRSWFSLDERYHSMQVDFSPDGQFVLSSATGGIALWRAADGNFFLKKNLEGVPSVSSCWWLSFAAKDRLLVTEEEVQVRQWPGLDLVATIPCPWAIPAPGTGLLLCQKGESIELWSLENQSVIKKIPSSWGWRKEHGCDVRWVPSSLSPDGQWLAVAYCEILELWRVADGQLVHRLKGEGDVDNLVFSPNGKLLAFLERQMNEDRIVEKVVVKLWDVENQRLVGAIVLEEECYELAFSPDGQLLLCWGRRRTNPVPVYRVPDGTLAFTIPVDAEGVAFSPDRLSLAVLGRLEGEEELSLSLWRLPKLK
jgi:WD40 repeat protein